MGVLFPIPCPAECSPAQCRSFRVSVVLLVTARLGFSEYSLKVLWKKSWELADPGLEPLAVAHRQGCSRLGYQRLCLGRGLGCLVTRGAGPGLGIGCSCDLIRPRPSPTHPTQVPTLT